jgi:hypothetical protein
MERVSMSQVSTAAAAATWRCARHPAITTRLRCDRCERAFCRDCLVSRFVTSRSSVWLCQRCAGIQSGRAFGGATGGLIRHPRATGVTGAAGRRGLGYWLAALGFAAFVLLTAAQRGMLG